MVNSVRLMYPLSFQNLVELQMFVSNFDQIPSTVRKTRFDCMEYRASCLFQTFITFLAAVLQHNSAQIVVYVEGYCSEISLNAAYLYQVLLKSEYHGM